MSAAGTSPPLFIQVVIEFAKLFVSALVSAFIAVKVVNRLKSRSDHVDKRIDELCSEIRAVANLATDYWMREPSNELKPLAAKIQAGIRFVEELRVATSDFAPELKSEMSIRASQEFFRAATGGDFGVHNRAANLDRSVSVQYVALRYVSVVRRARLSAS